MKHLRAEHGAICRLLGERFGYFAWPSVARLEDGTLAVISSGLRTAHICPWGKTVLHISHDDGRTWSPSRVIQDSPIDDRDVGIVSLGGNRLLVTWFRSDTRRYANREMPEEEARAWADAFSTWTDEQVDALVGSWLMLSDDAGTTWGNPIRVPVSTPHGPILLRNGDLLYMGLPYVKRADLHDDRSEMAVARSTDGGRTWTTIGQVPVCPNTHPGNYGEPHMVELPSGRLLALIRTVNRDYAELAPSGILNFSLVQTESEDGGCTWSVPRPLGFHGAPPHLLRHSSGVLVLTYGYRQEPYGQRVAISYDNGGSWDHDWILRDDGPDSDLGYPCTVEMADGSLFSVYYQKAAAGEKCSLLWSRWTLPE